MGDYTLEQVQNWVDNSSCSFKFKIYKKILTFLPHTGIMVYLDGRRSLTVDLAADKSRGKRVVDGPSNKAGCLVHFNDPSYGINIQETSIVQEICLKSWQDKETVKKILSAWYNADHGNYDHLDNNCCYFCDKCIDIAEQFHHLSKGGRASAKLLLDKTVTADQVYKAPLQLAVQLQCS